MIEIIWQGRVGNRMIQYAAAAILSEHTKLKILNSPYDIFINKYQGYENFLDYFNIWHCPYECQVQTPVIDLTDNLFLTYGTLKNITLPPAYYKFDGVGQLNDLLVEHTHFIRNIYKPKQLVEKKEGVWVHARLGDVDLHRSGTVEYYRKVLTKLNCKEGVITTDGMSVDHDLVKTLMKEFNLKLECSSPIETLINSLAYSKKVLSSGTFSWWMGVLGDNDVVYYYDVPENLRWHLPIFNRPDWIGLR